ncbi:MAG: RnfABCDGE type electron transport complex subunit D [bacterium]
MSGFSVTHAPHIRAKEDSANIMTYTIIALLPASMVGIYLFGINSIVLIVSSILAAVLTEYLMLFLRGKKAVPADVLSAVITGLLLVMVITPVTPWWMAAVGSIFAISIVKHAFGGLGFNIFNPALAARAFMLASWPVIMTMWPRPFDTVTGATHLALVKSGALEMSIRNMPEHIDVYWQLFVGNRAGCLGETSVIALLIGTALLLIKDIIDWRIPTGFILTVMVMSASFGSDPIFHILAGGLMLGAFFMATDPVTKPMGRAGRWVFGIGCGVITVVIRLLGGYPEGVCYAILIMNGFTPLIDRYVIDRVYGHPSISLRAGKK